MDPDVRDLMLFYEPVGLLIPAIYGIWFSSPKNAMVGMVASALIFSIFKAVLYFVSYMDGAVYGFDVEPLIHILTLVSVIATSAAGIMIMRGAYSSN